MLAYVSVSVRHQYVVIYEWPMTAVNTMKSGERSKKRPDTIRRASLLKRSYRTPIIWIGLISSDHHNPER